MTAGLLTVVILTYDEEANLPDTLESLRALGADVLVVDSGSRDRTVEIAERFGCKVWRHAFTTQAGQLNWALDSLPISTPWVMRLDADERVTPELVKELLERLPGASPQVAGWELKRRVHFWGRWIRHGGYYPTWLLRVWRHGRARSEERWMDEHIVLTEGTVARLCHDIIDENHKGLSFWVDKHNRYADREVQDMLGIAADGDSERLAGQAGRRRWLKANVYARAPLFVRALGYWFLRYFVRLGILDGIPGLVFHFNQGLWYRFLVDAKLHERRLRTRNSVISPGGDH